MHKLNRAPARLREVVVLFIATLVLAACSSGSKNADGTTTPGTVPNTPTISGTPPTSAQATVAYMFQPVASEAGGAALTFQIAKQPAWATFNSSTGVLSGVPSTTQMGSYSGIVISVSDGVNSAALPAFTIQVAAAPNQAPTISGTPPATATVGTAYSFTPTITNPAGGALTFSIQKMPTWATFSTTTGKLSGTPGSATAGTTYSGIVITVQVGALSASLPAFSIQVAAAGNRPPVISGAPATTIAAGSAYLFTPTASDPDGNALTFAIQNKPAWASFSTATGTLSGSPVSSDAGTYSNIIIAVSDGQGATTALATFTIVVTQSGGGSAVLNWTAPTLNTDGSALTDLSVFEIYYGTSPSALNQTSAAIPAGTITSTITGLSSGTWYFSMTAKNTGGTESARTSPVSKVVP